MDMDDGTIGLPLEIGTDEQKRKLYRLDELVPTPSGAIELAPTDPSKWAIWPRRDQGSSNTCVYQARAKAAGILREQTTGEFVTYSAADYNKRSNKPNPGAYPIEAFDFWRNDGIGLEVLEPSQQLDDGQLSYVTQSPFEVEVAKISRIENYASIALGDFDAMVATLNSTHKPIPMGIFATVSEWKRDIPVILDANLKVAHAPVRHEVCATPNVGIYEGLEGFTIEDSWGGTGIEGKGVRWITREFFSQRNYIAGLYPTTFKTYTEIGVDPYRPHVHLNVDLEFGMNHPVVFKLQQVYKYEGLFPANHPGSTLFHNITLNATKQFQVRYNISGPGKGGYGRVGPRTRAKINELYV